MEDCLFYDSAKTDNLSNYETSSYVDVTWETDGYYKIYQNTNKTFGYCNLLNKTFPNKVIIEFDAYSLYNDLNNQLRIGLYNPNNNNQGVVCNFSRDYHHMAEIAIRTGAAKKTLVDGWSSQNIPTAINFSDKTWYTLQLIIDGQNITLKGLDMNKTVLYTLTHSLSSGILSSEGNMLCMEHCYLYGAVTYVKNLKVKPYSE